MRHLLAAFTLLALVAPLPALAGANESALLASYAGTWTGKGEITGPEAGKVSCKLSMKATSTGKLTYNGRCSMSTIATGFNGTMQYNDSARRYEAITTARGESATAIGKPKGQGVVFTTSATDERGSVSSTIALAGDTITFSFKASASATDENISSEMVLTRQ